VNGYALLTSPRVVQASPKLIHKAVLLSGGLAQDQDLPQGAIPTLRSAGYAKAQATRLLLNLVIAAGKAKDDRTAAAWVQALPDAEVAAFLRAQPAAAVLREARSLPKWSLGATSHVPDGKVVADTPLAAIRDGAYLKVPLIVGITRDEGRLFTPYLALSPLLGGKPGLIVDDAQRLRMMLAFDGDAPPTLTEKDLINPAYLPAAARDTGYVDRTGLITTYLFKVNRDAMLGALEAQQKAIWAYQFAWDREPAPWNVVYGAAHAFDLPFLFGNFGPSLFSRAVNSKANLKGRLDLSAAMMGALGTFARTGDPNHAGLGIAWPAWPATLVFDADLEARRLSVR
jgi:para-nitrobenzyl esterase